MSDGEIISRASPIIQASLAPNFYNKHFFFVSHRILEPEPEGSLQNLKQRLGFRTLD